MGTVFSPQELGFPNAMPGEICGGAKQTKEDAKEIFDSVLQDKASESQKNVVLVNAGFAIKTIEKDKSIEECIAIARESIESGKAWNNFKKYVELNS